MIYPSNQKPPIWSIDTGVVAYNCRKHGMPHPVLAMPMWEGAGNRALDYSGHGNHGTLTNGPEWVIDGLEFIAANNTYVTVPQSVMSGSDFTISFWEKSEAGANTGYFCSDSNDPTNLLFRKWSTTQYTGYIGDVIFVAFNVQFGIWNHNVITHSGGNGYWYVNNVLKQSLAGSNFSGLNNAFYLGNRLDLTRSLDGVLRNISIYNIALSTAQRKFIHDNPYYMYQIPEELYGYVAEPPITFIPRIIMF